MGLKLGLKSELGLGLGLGLAASGEQPLEIGVKRRLQRSADHVRYKCARTGGGLVGESRESEGEGEGEGV